MVLKDREFCGSPVRTYVVLGSARWGPFGLWLEFLLLPPPALLSVNGTS